MEKYFIAYGTNIKADELAKSYPGAKILGYGFLHNYALEFVGYDEHAIATVTKKKGVMTPVAVWEFPKELRSTLTNFEDFPYLYKRIKVTAYVGGKTKMRGEIYVTKQNLRHGTPSKEYLEALREAYREAGFDEKMLDEALKEQPKD
ncbi:MAG: gamma-glutamylcyclotransferase [Clostridia bacterium]|nr:gamma-glutamylcyclotransferase [Clostridia bacterium]